MQCYTINSIAHDKFYAPEQLGDLYALHGAYLRVYSGRKKVRLGASRKYGE
jgi:hypothetical protein